jgi:hypothetical protein
LEDSEILEELTNRLDRGSFRPVIETDCIEKAGRLDQRRSVPIVRRVSRTIFLYSLIGAERVSGALPRDIKLGACHPGIDPGLVDEVLEEIDREFWYIKVEGGTYYFHTEPNINKIIYDYMGEVSDDEIRDVISKKIQEILGHTLNIKVVVWDSDGLEDGPEIKLMVVDYRGLRPGDEKAIVEGLLERRDGGKIREYRNTIVFLLPDLNAVQSLENSARMLCAVKKAVKDQRIVLDKEKVKRLKEREGRCEENLRIDCMNVYSKIAFPRVGDGQITIDDLHGLDGKANLTSVVFEKLKRIGKLIPESARLNPEELARILQANKTMKIGDIYELFRKDRTKPFILSGETILETVKAGVIRGEFGYAEILEERDGKYPALIGRSLPIVGWDGWLVEKQLVQAPRSQTQEEAIVTITERQDTLVEVVKPLPEVSFQIGSLKESLKRIAEVRALSPGKTFSVELRLEIHDENHRIRMVLECSEWRALSSDVERLLNLIDKAGKYTVSGYIKVASEDEGFIEELRRLVG